MLINVVNILLIVEAPKPLTGVGYFAIFVISGER